MMISRMWCILSKYVLEKFIRGLRQCKPADWNDYNIFPLCLLSLNLLLSNLVKLAPRWLAVFIQRQKLRLRRRFKILSDVNTGRMNILGLYRSKKLCVKTMHKFEKFRRQNKKFVSVNDRTCLHWFYLFLFSWSKYACKKRKDLK